MSQQCHCQKSTDNTQQVMDAARHALPAEVVALIEATRTLPHSESHLISVLHKLQSLNGFLGTEQLDAVAQLMQIPAAEVTGVATFYHFFRLKPRGKFAISICLGTACYVKGAQNVVDKLREELGIDFGETTKDGLFTLDATRCLGTCGLAPVMTVNDTVHPKVAPDQIPNLIRNYIKQAKNSG